MHGTQLETIEITKRTLLETKSRTWDYWNDQKNTTSKLLRPHIVTTWNDQNITMEEHWNQNNLQDSWIGFCFLQTLRGGGERDVISSSLECQTKLRVNEQNEGLARIETYDMMQFCSPLCCSWNPFTCMTIDS
jgi:hypothetical protein